MTAFAATSHFNPNEKSFPTTCVVLPAPTADPVLLTKAAHALLPHLHDGVKYVRAGIMVTDLRPTGNQKPLEIFENPHEERGIGTLLEDVTKRYGRGSIGLGHAGIRGGPDWTMKRDMLSPRYTTHWDELPLVKAVLHETPAALHLPGPHGISLLDHAKKGGHAETVAYLQHLLEPDKARAARAPKPKAAKPAKPKRRRAA